MCAPLAVFPSPLDRFTFFRGNLRADQIYRRILQPGCYKGNIKSTSCFMIFSDILNPSFYFIVSHARTHVSYIDVCTCMYLVHRIPPHEASYLVTLPRIEGNRPITRINRLHVELSDGRVERESIESHS